MINISPKRNTHAYGPTCLLCTFTVIPYRKRGIRNKILLNLLTFYKSYGQSSFS